MANFNAEEVVIPYPTEPYLPGTRVFKVRARDSGTGDWVTWITTVAPPTTATAPAPAVGPYVDLSVIDFFFVQ